MTPGGGKAWFLRPHRRRALHLARLALGVLGGALIATTLCGCWSMVEVEDLAHVVALGFDVAPDDARKVEVYTQVLNPVSPVTTPEGGGGAGSAGPGGDRALGKPYVTMKVAALTVFEAVHKLDTLTTRRLHGGHMVLVVFGERMARKGIRPTLDILLRHHQLRRTVRVMVTPDPVGDVMEAPAALSAVPALGVEGLLNEQSAVSLAWSMTINDFLCSLDEAPGCDPVTGLITVGPGRASVIPPIRVVRVEGAAAFVRDRYVGRLCAHETRGMLWVTGRVKGSLVSLECPEVGPGIFGLEVFGERSKLSHSYRGGVLTITARVTVNADVGEVRGRADLRNPKVVDAIARTAASAIEAEMARAVRKLQSYGSDAVDFGAYLRRADGALWKELGPRWRSEFRKVEFVPRAKVIIRGTGLVLGT